MDRGKVEATIREIIACQLLGKDPEQDLESFLSNRETEIIDETSIVNDLGADSLDSVELVMELEEEFDISITDAEAEGLHRVSDYVAVVLRKTE